MNNVNLFIIISFLNISIIFLIRFLVKKNIFLNKLAYVTILLQILTIVISLFRKRNFENVPFEIIFITLSLTFYAIYLIPLFLNKILSENKKIELNMLELDVKMFLLKVYDNFIEKYIFLEKLFSFFSKYLTRIFRYLIFSNLFLHLLTYPWLFLQNFVLFESFFSQKFLLAPYFIVYFFVTYRIVVLLLYISKNTAANYYIFILRQKLFCYYDLDMLLNMNILKTIVLNKKFVNFQEKVEAWKNFNKFLYFFIESKILSNFFYVDLTEIKKYFDSMNFNLFLCISLFLLQRTFLDLGQKSYVIFLFLYTLLSCFFIKQMRETSENPDVKNFKNLLFFLKEFLGVFKWTLMKDHQFSLADTHEKLQKPIRTVLPTNIRIFFTKITIFHLLTVWSFTLFWIIPGSPDFLIKFLFWGTSCSFLEYLIKLF